MLKLKGYNLYKCTYHVISSMENPFTKMTRGKYTIMLRMIYSHWWRMAHVLFGVLFFIFSKLRL